MTALPNWGSLTKATDDATTIDDAIAAAIVAHEADAAAHLGAGESLQSHKSESVIDHPQESIVYDKAPFNQYMEESANAAGTDWAAWSGTLSTINGREVGANLSAQTAVGAYNPVPMSGGAFYPDADLTVQFMLSLRGFSSADGVILFELINNDTTSDNRIWFEKVGTAWHFRVKEAGTTTVDETLPFANDEERFYRLYWDWSNQTITLFAGTSVVVSFTPVDYKILIFDEMDLTMSRTTNTQIYFNLHYWKLSYSKDIEP